MLSIDLGTETCKADGLVDCFIVDVSSSEWLSLGDTKSHSRLTLGQSDFVRHTTGLQDVKNDALIDITGPRLVLSKISNKGCQPIDCPLELVKNVVSQAYSFANL